MDQWNTLDSVEPDDLFLRNAAIGTCNEKFVNRAILVRSTLAALAGVDREVIRSDMTARQYRSLCIKANGTVRNWKNIFCR